MEPIKVSSKLLKRLPLYLNYLKSLPEHTENVSATAIAKALGLGDVQVRKDLAQVSHEGRRRTGRSRQQLIADIEACLDFSNETGAILVGVGKLGQALLDYRSFNHSGINLMAGFDLQPEARQSETGKPIYPMRYLKTFCKCCHVEIAVLTVPAECAQDVCNMLISCGITAIWNFTPVTLTVPENVAVQNENLAVSLSQLRMQLKVREDT